LLKDNFPDRFKKVRFPESAGYGIKPVSQQGTERLVRAAIRYALENGRTSLTLVHKGNIMKFTEGAFRDWGYQTAAKNFGATPLDGGPWHVIDRKSPADITHVPTQAGHAKADASKLIVKDVIADAFLQQLLT